MRRKKDRTPEEEARREKIRELLRLAKRREHGRYP